MARRATAAPLAATPFDFSVFVNCPFDDDYLPLLHALLFTIHDCGFIARIALEDAGGGEMRIDKIVRLINDCRYSIHDISRIEMSGPANLPRFNMPFEAGLAFGAIKFGLQSPKRDLLLLEAEAHRDKKTLSDLAGQDTKIHGGDRQKLIGAVRSFLAAKTPRDQKKRGEGAIWQRYQKFEAALPGLATKAELSETEVTSFDYLRDWLQLMSEWMLSQQRSTPKRSSRQD